MTSTAETKFTTTLKELRTSFQKDSTIIDRKPFRFFGWIRRVRTGDSGAIAFVDIYDGTLVGDLKCLAHGDYYKGTDYTLGELTQDEEAYTTLTFEQLSQAEHLSPGCSVVADGLLVPSPAAASQDYELQIHCLRLIGGVEDAETYPIQKSTMKSIMALRTHPFMRPASQATQSLFRIRSVLKFAIDSYMHKHGVVLTDPNILTMSDCEGAGETFSIAPSFFSKDKEGKQLPVGLTVSSQLPLEAMILGFSQVYTSQKSFRAEKSDTSKHLAEFLHIEYEGCMDSLEKLLDFTEKLVKMTMTQTFEECKEDFDWLESKFAPRDMVPTRTFLQEQLKKPFVQIKHCEAIELIQEMVREKMVLPDESGKMKRVKVKKYPAPGEDLWAEHEKLLVTYFGFKMLPKETQDEWIEAGKAEHEVGAFVFVTHWPLAIKSFYMAQCDDGSGECLSFDLLCPRVGEMFGGSMREWRYDKLAAEIERRGMDIRPIQWFLDLRKTGSRPHGGWGLGFDRMVMMITGAPSVRDVVPFPVYFGHCPY